MVQEYHRTKKLTRRDPSRVKNNRGTLKSIVNSFKDKRERSINVIDSEDSSFGNTFKGKILYGLYQDGNFTVMEPQEKSEIHGKGKGRGQGYFIVHETASNSGDYEILARLHVRRIKQIDVLSTNMFIFTTDRNRYGTPYSQLNKRRPKPVSLDQNIA